MPHNFALLGVAGFVAPRHLKAIQDTGNRLLAACDPYDSVGVVDSYFPDAAFFTEVERFDRFLEKQRRKPGAEQVDYLSICSPNYLHDAHVRLALRVGAHAICEKPLVINPWNLEQLADLDAEYEARVYTVLQLRLLPALAELKARLAASPLETKADVVLSYVTRRGRWYHVSWKGDEAKSGGLVMNIGVHFFDLILWLFGGVQRSEVHLYEPDRAAGFVELEHANVRWFLSTNAEDLPEEAVREGKHAFRSLTRDGEELEFSTGFGDLHTRVYELTLAGDGFGIEDARPSIELAYAIRKAPVTAPGDAAHPWLEGVRGR